MSKGSKDGRKKNREGANMLQEIAERSLTSLFTIGGVCSGLAGVSSIELKPIASFDREGKMA